MDERYEELRIENELLKIEIETLKRQLALATGKPVVEVERPLTVYPDIESIDWEAERYQDTPETRAKFNNNFMIWTMGGSKPNDPIYPPYRNVMVDGEGEIRRVPGGWNPATKQKGMAGPDWYLIAVMRIVNVLAKQYCAYVQSGDDKVEEDRDDQDALVRRYAYRGYGFRYPPQDWTAHSRGAELLVVYRAIRDLPSGDYQAQRIPVAPAP